MSRRCTPPSLRSGPERVTRRSRRLEAGYGRRYASGHRPRWRRPPEHGRRPCRGPRRLADDGLRRLYLYRRESAVPPTAEQLILAIEDPHDARVPAWGWLRSAPAMSLGVTPVDRVRLWEAQFRAMEREWGEISVRRTRVLMAAWRVAMSEMRRQHDRLVSDGLWVTGPSDFLAIMDQARAENTHSRMLRWLLKPTGRHGLGCGLVRRLVEHCTGEPAPASLAVRGVGFSQWRNDREADLVVWGEDFTLVIENKVDGTEQPRQCDDCLHRSAAQRVDAPPARAQNGSTQTLVVLHGRGQPHADDSAQCTRCRGAGRSGSGGGHWTVLDIDRPPCVHPCRSAGRDTRGPEANFTPDFATA